MVHIVEKSLKHNNNENCTLQEINIEFSNLEYSVPDPKAGQKRILKNIYGEFRGQQLSVILGPSGGGKTSLLKILAGYETDIAQGSIQINKRVRDLEKFRKICHYVPQKDYIAPYLTIKEFMILASNLKNGSSLSAIMKMQKIMEILNTFQLEEHQYTFVKYLSGGEKKRLSISLELLNNPSVLLLDEPTTGLDEYSAAQCVSLLKRSAENGCTVICSMHTPSARLCQLFDKVYVLAEGKCLYQGPPSMVVSYLHQLDLHCPTTYNPADYIIECANDGNHQRAMCEAIENGRIYNWSIDQIDAVLIENNFIDSNSHHNAHNLEIKLIPSHCTWWMQYKILMMRMLLQSWRDKFMMKMKIFIHILIALSIGTTYFGLGTDATMAFYLYHFSFFNTVVFVFTTAFPVITRMPMELKYLKREYSNQWYDLSAYYMALITAQLPEIFLFGIVSSAISYSMTYQPLEMNRYILFLMPILLVSMVASSYGILLASFLNLRNVVFFTSASIGAFILFALQTVANPDLSFLEHFVINISFFRHAAACIMLALMKFDRPDAPCPNDQMICIFKLSYIMKAIGFDNLSYSESFVILLGFYLFFNLTAFSLIRYRLKSNPHFASRIEFLLAKYLNITLT